MPHASRHARPPPPRHQPPRVGASHNDKLALPDTHPPSIVLHQHAFTPHFFRDPFPIHLHAPPTPLTITHHHIPMHPSFDVFHLDMASARTFVPPAVLSPLTREMSSHRAYHLCATSPTHPRGRGQAWRIFQQPNAPPPRLFSGVTGLQNKKIATNRLKSALPDGACTNRQVHHG